TLTIYLDSDISSNTTYRYYIFAVSDAGVGNRSEPGHIEVGDLSKIWGKPVNDGEERFPWLVLITIIILVLALIGGCIFYLLKKKGQIDEPHEEGSYDFKNIAIDGKESDFPDDDVERAPPIN
ncbi:MAG: hypothetical protein KAH57_05215, partial [Thermoplasmata archaeon]|nr:hypothetical protein [Thermoplasmata archaeon]